ncbi:dehydrogenase, partial [Wolbachia endosymbiont of Drosophila chauvacae]|nr:dehydrogenase [Wolbachia endosymbiont of Drosophila chauvacae]
KDDKIIGLDIKNGETVWASDLIENTQLFAPIMHAHTLWVTSNKGSMFAFPGSESAGKVVKVPGNVFHTPVFTRNKIYVTTEGKGVYSLENRFVFYD